MGWYLQPAPIEPPPPTHTHTHTPKQAHSGAVHSVALSPDCGLVASGGGDASLRVADVELGGLSTATLRVRGEGGRGGGYTRARTRAHTHAHTNTVSNSCAAWAGFVLLFC